MTSDLPPRTSPSEIFRQIEDSNSGEVWMLLRDPGKPGAPGRWIHTEQPKSGAERDARECAPSSAQLPVIRAGDALIVEEHSARVDARLEAVAVTSAVKGEALRARLKIGGSVVRVVAVAPGRAVLEPESENQR